MLTLCQYKFAVHPHLFSAEKKISNHPRKMVAYPTYPKNVTIVSRAFLVYTQLVIMKRKFPNLSAERRSGE